MSRRWNVALCMMVGFCGGILAPYVSGRLVHAQELSQSRKVVTAEKFVLINEQGASAGIFGFDSNGSPEITLLDARGNVIWSTKLRAQSLSR
jgi:hypothetical protein